MSTIHLRPSYDAVVVGSGPNGLSAAVHLARAGRSVLVAEAYERVGGGCRSAELTLPGFVHDICSAIHPLAIASPAFRQLPLARHGLRFVQPAAPLAHPLDDGTAAVLERSVAATAAGLGRDGGTYRRVMGPLVDTARDLLDDILGPLRLPRHPLALARFGMLAVLPAVTAANLLFKDQQARALFAGLAGHSILPLTHSPSAAFAFVLGMLGHAVGWPIAVGGSERIARALASYLTSLGGEIRTDWRVDALDELPASRAVLMDITPKQVLEVAGARLPAWYQAQLRRYRYGPGVFKLDWALDGPIPWTARECARAGTVHLGGSLEEMADAEKQVADGAHPQRPFVILAQQSLFDPLRAEGDKHTAWAYCHVPNRSDVDMAGRIEAQVERFAPGFRARILARHAMSPSAMQAYNANYVGGDINGGIQDLGQLFTRPTISPVPYKLPAEGLYLCSSSTPPGGGVHGMCGYLAAQAALRGTLAER